MGMIRLRNLAAALALAAAWLPAPAAAEAPSPRLEALLADLADPERDDWMRIESEIVREWSRSGSDAMDLLLRRGQDALEAEDWRAALEHLTALVDHAPDFAEGWNARATAFYMLGWYGPAIADIEEVLRLNPRHFGALAGLGTILESMGQPELALEAFEAAQALHPHRPEIVRGVERLERRGGGADL
jgi:tetratricopeptide (TPR) repeat protein